MVLHQISGLKEIRRVRFSSLYNITFFAIAALYVYHSSRPLVGKIFGTLYCVKDLVKRYAIKKQAGLSGNKAN